MPLAPASSSPLAPSLVATFADALVRWQAEHGRNHLPWQATRDPYRVWLSEIMLQQTQVSTVLAYYARFLAALPDVASLAAAPQDQVMALWSGLGYYSRARNLHRCAQVVVAEHGGQFPRSSQALAQLPGIGRSTAAAIAAFCFDERAAILDANVKRVLTRVLAFAGDLAQSAQEKQLWQYAQQLLPARPSAMPRYTQALMDLGATLCLPRKTACLLCPVHGLCQAHRAGNPLDYPVKTRTLRRSSQAWWLLFIQDHQNRWWLQRRPAHGGPNAIWAGLFSPLVLADAAAAAQAAAALHVRTRHDAPVLQHVLTHRDLFLHPVLLRLQADSPDPVGDGSWFTEDEVQALGLPAPVKKLFATLNRATTA